VIDGLRNSFIFKFVKIKNIIKVTFYEINAYIFNLENLNSFHKI